MSPKKNSVPPPPSSNRTTARKKRSGDTSPASPSAKKGRKQVLLTNDLPAKSKDRVQVLTVDHEGLNNPTTPEQFKQKIPKKSKQQKPSLVDSVETAPKPRSVMLPTETMDQRNSKVASLPTNDEEPSGDLLVLDGSEENYANFINNLVDEDTEPAKMPANPTCQTCNGKSRRIMLYSLSFQYPNMKNQVSVLKVYY